ncbi:uncharacterized protein Pyn_29688 [Prunus yedoensis var. nudiflora]|uniref:Uncharacterized protein n=1 Tax=Prunus yedoensis var. nudiflora TaxID=2094558 RepID=A0A314YPY7_PRUYE|nr:uncharacterized protein Pyn_29688 [Prunus yedoensis var. nudiflora]
MEWSPQDALKAYLHTLHLCKVDKDEDLSLGNHTTTTSIIVEPKCMEFISALAAGKRARLILQITSQGITPMTVSLAVAAKQSGGRLIVWINSEDVDRVEKISKTLFVENGLDEVIEYVYGTDPCMLVKQLKNIDFAVVDFKLKDHLKLLKIMNFNPNGCVVVGTNVDDPKTKRDFGGPMILDRVFKEKKGFRYVTLPLGEGMELTRFRAVGNGGKCHCQSKRYRRYRRFHVTFEN